MPAYDLAKVLDRLQRPDWFDQPFSTAELELHPDRSRIIATVEAALIEVARLEDADPEADQQLDD